MKGTTPMGNIRNKVHTSSYYTLISKVKSCNAYIKIKGIDQANGDDTWDFSLENIKAVVTDPISTQVHSTDQLHMLKILFLLSQDITDN